MAANWLVVVLALGQRVSDSNELPPLRPGPRSFAPAVPGPNALRSDAPAIPASTATRGFSPPASYSSPAPVAAPASFPGVPATAPTFSAPVSPAAFPAAALPAATPVTGFPAANVAPIVIDEGVRAASVEPARPMDAGRTAFADMPRSEPRTPVVDAGEVRLPQPRSAPVRHEPSDEPLSRFEPIDPEHTAAPPTALANPYRAEVADERRAPRSFPSRFDPSVQRTQAVITASPAHDLLRAVLSNPDQILEGTPLSMLHVLGRIDGPRFPAVRAYWSLSRALADLRYERDEVQFLAGVQSRGSRIEQSLLATTVGDAQARELGAKVAAQRQQFDFAALAGLPTERLPLPSDVPLAGAYRTKFHELFANRTAPAHLQRIDRALPDLHRLIEARANAVVAAQETLNGSLEAYRGNQMPLDDVLKSFERLRTQRRAFLNAVYEYNQQIAEYALSVTRPGLPAQTVAAMLVRIDTAPPQFGRSPVRPATIEQPLPTESTTLTPLRF